MKISASQYASALFDLTAGKTDKEARSAIKNFVSVLGKNRDLNKLEEIATAFNEIWSREHNEISATLLSARELSAATKDSVVNYLKEKTGAKKVILESETDTSVLGGFVLRYGSKVLDGSLKNSLNSLKNKISN